MSIKTVKDIVSDNTELELLSEYARAGLSIAAIARRLGVMPHTFANWLRRGDPLHPYHDPDCGLLTQAVFSGNAEGQYDRLTQVNPSDWLKHTADVHKQMDEFYDGTSGVVELDKQVRERGQQVP